MTTYYCVSCEKFTIHSKRITGLYFNGIGYTTDEYIMCNECKKEVIL